MGTSAIWAASIPSNLSFHLLLLKLCSFSAKSKSFFAQNGVCKPHSWWVQSSHLFIFIVPIVWLYYILLSCIPLDRYFDCFHFFFYFSTSSNKVTMSILAQSSFSTCSRVFLGFIPRSRIASHQICLPPAFQDTAFKDDLKIYCPTARTSVILRKDVLTLNIVRFLNFLQINDCEVVLCRVVLILISLTSSNFSHLYFPFLSLFLICWFLAFAVSSTWLYTFFIFFCAIIFFKKFWYH